MHSTESLISSLDATLQHLVANADSMPLDIMRRTRDEAITLGTALLNQRIDDLTTDQVWQVNDLVCMLDRVGR
jgi:hypothetical protein